MLWQQGIVTDLILFYNSMETCLTMTNIVQLYNNVAHFMVAVFSPALLVCCLK